MPAASAQSKSKFSREAAPLPVQKTQAIEKTSSSQLTHSIEKTLEQKTLERHSRESLKNTQPTLSRSISKTQATDRKAQIRNRKSGKKRMDDKSREARNQHDDGTHKNTKAPPGDKPKAPPIEAQTARSLPQIKGVKTAQDEEMPTVARLDEEPTIVQGPPNRYEADAGQKKMVVDPVLVNKRGNIDKIYTKVRPHFVNQLREAELPSDRGVEKPDAKPSKLKLRFNDEKCEVFETNDEPTIDDMEEQPPDPEEDFYLY
ncbi:hypothetical protein Y032_0046g1301 [Ancylostoma ceylanicum]|nr:hypothetical protein Y032_0046g1301 [Ancylostoma ceylanicum]